MKTLQRNSQMNVTRLAFTGARFGRERALWLTPEIFQS
jgi:hypothetical protein